MVDTQSVGSTATGVRDYTVSVDEPGAGWTTVSTVVGQYRNHEMQLAFDPVAASAVQITVSEVNFGGYYGGGVPPWWPPTQIATAFLHAIQVYAGTGTPAQVDGTGLTPLTPGFGGTTATNHHDDDDHHDDDHDHRATDHDHHHDDHRAADHHDHHDPAADHDDDHGNADTATHRPAVTPSI